MRQWNYLWTPDASSLQFSNDMLCTAEANKSWFHLYRLLLPGQELEQGSNHAQSLAAAVEQFMQSSPVGEYQSRLDLVWSFRCAETTVPACMPSGCTLILTVILEDLAASIHTCTMS